MTWTALEIGSDFGMITILEYVFIDEPTSGSFPIAILLPAVLPRHQTLRSIG